MTDIIALKHNGETAKIFHDLKMVMQDEHIIVLYGPAGTHVDDVRKHISWDMHYAAYHVLMRNEPYNVLIVEKEQGNEYYCNLASVPTLDGDTISYIDYDIDVVKSPDGTIAVHDLDQFAERSVQWNYPADLVAALSQKQAEIEQALQAESDYFSPDFYRSIVLINRKH